jgi:hypothetical protein
VVHAQNVGGSSDSERDDRNKVSPECREIPSDIRPIIEIIEDGKRIVMDKRIPRIPIIGRIANAYAFPDRILI